MNAAALLRELEAAGVRLSLKGEGLHIQARPGVSIAPHREQITEHKRALVTELRLREEIVAAASAAHARFERARFDELWRRWSELQEENVR